MLLFWAFTSTTGSFSTNYFEIKHTPYYSILTIDHVFFYNDSRRGRSDELQGAMQPFLLIWNPSLSYHPHWFIRGLPWSTIYSLLDMDCLLCFWSPEYQGHGFLSNKMTKNLNLWFCVCAGLNAMLLCSVIMVLMQIGTCLHHRLWSHEQYTVRNVLKIPLFLPNFSYPL